MSKPKARASLYASLNGWDRAIADAEETIRECEGRIARLSLSIKTFVSLRDRGEPFPSQRMQRPKRRKITA